MLRVLVYGPGAAAFREVPASALAGVVEAAADAPFLWIDASDPAAEETQALAAALGWHRLLTEDIGTGGQRQKVERFRDELLLVVRRPDPANLAAEFEEIDIVVGKTALVTVTRRCSLDDGLGSRTAARDDVEENGPMVGVLVVLDDVVIRYEQAIEELEERVGEQEDTVLARGDGDPLPMLERNAAVRHQIARLRRGALHLEETVGTLARRELAERGRSDELDLELRDVEDHAIRAADSLAMLFERMASLAETRLALVAFEQNEITKRLSAWGALLIAPSVVTGWFGQNFRGLTGLEWQHGELYALALILAISASLLVTFRRAGWL